MPHGVAPRHLRAIGVGRRWPIIVGLLAASLVSCTTSRTDSPTGTGTVPTTSAAPRLLNVSAASSLTEPFTEIAKLFEAAMPGVTVRLNFGGSTALVEQVEQGAPVDAIATADETSMERLRSAGLLAGPPVVVARNQLALLVEPGNPLDIDTLADLARPDVAVSLCADTVPCGAYAAAILARAQVAVTPRSLEENVKGVVTKVQLGEVDVGIAYLTDALAAEDSTDLVRIPDAQNVTAAYPAAVPRTARDAALAQEFVEFLSSPDAQDVLDSHGFLRA